MQHLAAHDFRIYHHSKHECLSFSIFRTSLSVTRTHSEQILYFSNKLELVIISYFSLRPFSQRYHAERPVRGGLNRPERAFEAFDFHLCEKSQYFLCAIMVSDQRTTESKSFFRATILCTTLAHHIHLSRCRLNS